MFIDDTLLLAVHTANKQLRLYTVRIDWQASKTSETQSITPSISLIHLTCLDVCAPLIDESPHTISSLQNNEFELSHLMLIPRSPTTPGQPNTSSPIVLCCFFAFFAVFNFWRSTFYYF
jgi:hypothetical protein